MPPPFKPSALDGRIVTARRTMIGSLVLALCVPAIMVMADLHWRTGFDIWRGAHLAVFATLTTLIAFGAAQALMGFYVRRRGGDPYSITSSLIEETTQPIDAPVAVVMPIFNEDVSRVIAGFRKTYESVIATGQVPNCDFFLLSDSTDPNRWVEEESAWLALTETLGARGRMFYRKRRISTNKKAGNLADFCRRWGSGYVHMIVLDADSIMTGESVAQLVRLMEKNPGVGIIQGVPRLVGGETILARLQQFASRLYGPIFSSGLNYWQLSEGNYWGHNAIIRLEPFIRHCSLPELPGDGPFGGRILSHDYVEAALMRRAGWQVWLAPELAGNFEECPASLIDFAKRDRRWLQGNLQHARLVAARDFHIVNRAHFTLGILSYLSSPLWLILLIVSAVVAWDNHGLTEGPAHIESFAKHLHWSLQTQSLCLFGYTLLLLLAPKALALWDLKTRPSEVAGFGGWGRIATGVGLETLTFTLLAPILMAFHTQFIVLTLCRRPITWGTQRRGRDGAAGWREAFSAHLGHMLLGVFATLIVASINGSLAAWMSPVLAGLILSIPLSYVTGSFQAGLALKSSRIWITPEEVKPEPELSALVPENHDDARIPEPLRADYGLLQAVLDPYVNATHIALLRNKDNPVAGSVERFAGLRQKLVQEGPGSLAANEKMSLLMDSDSMTRLHDELWSLPGARLGPWWQAALRHYSAASAPPDNVFARMSPPSS